MTVCTVLKIEAVGVRVFVEVNMKTKCGVYRQKQGPCTSLLSRYKGCKLQSNPRPAPHCTQTRTEQNIFLFLSFYINKSGESRRYKQWLFTFLFSYLTYLSRIPKTAYCIDLNEIL